MIRALSLATVFLCTGCYHLAGAMKVESEVVSTPVGTRTEVTPTRAKVEAQPTLGNDALLLDVQKVHWCRDDSVEVLTNVRKTTETMPASHWALLGTGTALGVGGLVTALAGNSMMSDQSRGVLGTPAQEKRYDTGRIVFPVGLVVASVGGILLGSELVDALLPGRHSEALPPSTRMIVAGEERVCRRDPIQSAPITISAPGGKLMLHTDDAGRASVGLEDAKEQLFKGEVDKPAFRLAVGGVDTGTTDAFKPVYDRWVREDEERREAEASRLQVEVERQAAELAARKKQPGTLGVMPGEITGAFLKLADGYYLQQDSEIVVASGEEYAGHDRGIYTVRMRGEPASDDAYNCALQITSLEGLAKEVSILCPGPAAGAVIGMRSVVVLGFVTAATTGVGSPPVLWAMRGMNGSLKRLQAKVASTGSDWSKLGAKDKRSHSFDRARVEVTLNPMMFLLTIRSR